jgi:hypothetical protein
MGRGGISIFHSSVGSAAACEAKGPQFNPWAGFFFFAFFLHFNFLWGFLRAWG